MTENGTNGIQDGEENFRKVEQWVSERNRLRDWDDYRNGGKIHRGDLADELGFGRSACNQNPRIKELLLKYDKIWFGTEPKSKDDQIAAQEASIERARGSLQNARADNNKSIGKIAELEAEVRRLEKIVDKYKRLHGLIETGDPGCRI